MEKENEEVTTSTASNKTAYVVFVIAILLVGGGVFWAAKNLNKPSVPEQVLGQATERPKGPPSLKGQKFSDTNLADSAELIYPGTISESAKAVMSGWDLKTKVLPDGTTQVDLVPVGSEATEGDTSHSFVLKTGDKLYFVDLNPGDDSSTEDANTHDDMGIVVDANGVIQ